MQKPDIVKEWIKYAETDLASANHLLGMHPIPIEIICYHCAQSAEKALKAFLIAKDVEPPRTHDSRFLNRLCSRHDRDFQQLEQACIELTAYATQPRYPFMIEISSNDMKQALLAADKILKFVLTKLQLEDQ